MRRLVTFPCEGERLVGTLDEAGGKTGLLIVSGGREIRMGAHRGMALLAARVAERGHPVFRFDRRGIGDSSGSDRGFLGSAADMVAAAAEFRALVSGLDRIVAFGNCDAATALALFGARAGVDALVLANPWVVEQGDSLPPAAAIRSHYAKRLRDPKQWLRLAKDGVNISKLAKGLQKLAAKRPEQEQRLGARFAAALNGSDIAVTILLAKGDNTAIAFADAWRDAAFDRTRERVTLQMLDSASHSFASVEDKDWLFGQVVAALDPTEP